jgi:hypothetical protein
MLAVTPPFEEYWTPVFGDLEPLTAHGPDVRTSRETPVPVIARCARPEFAHDRCRRERPSCCSFARSIFLPMSARQVAGDLAQPEHESRGKRAGGYPPALGLQAQRTLADPSDRKP